jgi:hypothetical protein
MGIALGLGGFTHPFLPSHVLAGLGLLVAAVGFAGASWALLRTSNDDFDLPRCRRLRNDHVYVIIEGDTPVAEGVSP